MKYILIVISDEGKEEFFGPFDSGEQAVNWGALNFGEDYTIASVPLKEPK